MTGTRGAHRTMATFWLVKTLKAIRKSRGFSQMNVANKMGTGQNYICSLELGRRGDPQLSTFGRWGDALDVEMTVRVIDRRSGDVWNIPLTGPGLEEKP